MRNVKGTLILLLTAFIWGVAFVAQTSASDTIGAFTFTACRSVLASIFLFLFALARDTVKNRTREAKTPLFTKQIIISGILCGLPLCIASLLQQFGIQMYPAGTATSGRAGFLTAVYVILVALYELIRSRRFRIIIILATIICMSGTYMLCLSNGLTGFYLGDIPLLLCAVGFAVYILVVDRFGTVDTIKVSCIQFALTSIISLMGMFLFETPVWSDILSAAIPICYAGICSSGIAYTLQMVGQKYAEPAVATIVMSLESVFAALAGWFILHERLQGSELIGCILVFAAVILAQFPEKIKS